MAKLETKIYDARISDLTETEHNPRQISKTDFDKLKKSLKEFPEMLEIREVVIDGKKVHCPQTIDAVRKYLDPDAQVFKTQGKRKYIYPLTKQMRVMAESLRKPYPKKGDK